jgi:hypothetical protein
VGRGWGRKSPQNGVGQVREMGSPPQTRPITIPIFNMVDEISNDLELSKFFWDKKKKDSVSFSFFIM